jgi:hypothetical protein
MESDDDPISAAAREHSRRAWDARVRKGQRFMQPAADEDVARPQEQIDTGWLGRVLGKRLLCLASAGG